MRELWETPDLDSGYVLDYDSDQEDDLYHGMHAIAKAKSIPLHAAHESIGVTLTLKKVGNTVSERLSSLMQLQELSVVVDESVAGLKKCFQDGLEEKCDAGAQKVE